MRCNPGWQHGGVAASWGQRWLWGWVLEVSSRSQGDAPFMWLMQAVFDVCSPNSDEISVTISPDPILHSVRENIRRHRLLFRFLELLFDGPLS